jgi:hypothetical protein
MLDPLVEIGARNLKAPVGVGAIDRLPSIGLLNEYDVYAVAHPDADGRMVPVAHFYGVAPSHIATQHLSVEQLGLGDISDRKRETIDALDVY